MTLGEAAKSLHLHIAVAVIMASVKQWAKNDEWPKRSLILPFLDI